MADKETKDLEKEIKELKKSLRFESNRADTAEQEVVKLIEELEVVQEQEALPPSDGVVFRGQHYNIVAADTAKEISEQMKKRFVDADQTVIVINRHGS